MLTQLKSMFSSAESAGQSAGGHSRLEWAAAALLVNAAVIDGHFDTAEREVIENVLRDRFDLDEEALGELIEEAVAEVDRSAQFFAFTKAIKDNTTHEERFDVIRMLWEVAYADGVLHDFEASLVRRVCGLIHVPDKESGLARRRALENLGLESI